MRSAAILAGGKASRFDGRDKSALVVEGRSILDRQLAEISTVADDIMVVGGASDRLDHLRGSADQAARPRAVADIVRGGGPLGGLHAALSAARADTVFVVACDMPYV